ncbi:hypothetical protein DXG03_008541 [Asterophora parasitica]|uniref:Lysozyme n=1 Tax=Asterophora parasitica TaxID=117018 RepID=A0A9P7KE34_9AGAR|nr:hypothetical protein DXG03_008541 [Asterophora parasitica]
MFISFSIPAVLLILSNTLRTTVNAAPALYADTRACIAGSDGRCVTTGYKSAHELESRFGLSNIGDLFRLGRSDTKASSVPVPVPAAAAAAKAPPRSATPPVATNPKPPATPAKTGSTSVGSCGAPGINSATVSLIKSFEGFVPRPAPDPIGLPTVGFGHLCKTKGCAEVPFRFPLSQSTAGSLLQSDVQPFVNCINAAVGKGVVLSDNQLGALVSWSFNVGCGAAKKSSLMKRLNNGEDPKTVAAQELPKFNRAGGKVLGGLTRRRAAEVKLFHTSSSIKAHPC